MPSLTEKQRDDWARALVSGEYTQCYGTLANDKGGHCCLGVAYVTWTGKQVPPFGSQERDDAYALVEDAIGPGAKLDFTALNDGGRSFAAIATEVRGLRAVKGE